MIKRRHRPFSTLEHQNTIYGPNYGSLVEPPEAKGLLDLPSEAIVLLTEEQPIVVSKVDEPSSPPSQFSLAPPPPLPRLRYRSPLSNFPLAPPSVPDVSTDKTIQLQKPKPEPEQQNRILPPTPVIRPDLVTVAPEEIKPQSVELKVKRPSPSKRISILVATGFLAIIFALIFSLLSEAY